MSKQERHKKMWPKHKRRHEALRRKPWPYTQLNYARECMNSQNPMSLTQSISMSPHTRLIVDWILKHLENWPQLERNLILVLFIVLPNVGKLAYKLDDDWTRTLAFSHQAVHLWLKDVHWTILHLSVSMEHKHAVFSYQILH